MHRSPLQFQGVGLALGLILASNAAFAAQEPIRLTSGIYQEQAFTAPDGSRKVRQVPASLISPGSEVVYVVTYANVSDKPANIVITNPLPRDVSYRSASASYNTTRTEVSVDGGRTWGELTKLVVRGADGKLRRANGGDITHVRWKLARTVLPGERGQVSLRGVLRN